MTRALDEWLIGQGSDSARDPWSRTQGLVREGMAAEIESAVPLSVTLGERVETLRPWARGRAVPAA